MSEHKSPEVYQVGDEEEDDDSVQCAGCDKWLPKGAPIMVLSGMWFVCLTCLQWALPTREDLQTAVELAESLARSVKEGADADQT